MTASSFEGQGLGGLIEEETSSQTQAALSVSAAMGLAKRSLEDIVVRILGEVSEVSNKPGYKAVYFSVKDSSASLPCMMWNNRYLAAGVELRVGMLVELTGRFTLYAPKGRMNFDVFSLSLAGEGSLRLQVANLARKLSAEGLMSQERKRPLPLLPQTIGVVTSPRGAAVHDVLRTLRRRYPLARVLLAGVPVEGADAPRGLIEALGRVSAAGAEVVLLVRGGGSFEDLMSFNDEALARFVASMPVPVVTGIGHEPDTTIADMVSDLRASTPTAAAESVAPTLESLRQQLQTLTTRLYHDQQRQYEALRHRVDRIGDLPLFQEPQRLFDSEALALDELSLRLRHIGETFTNRYQTQLSVFAARLHDLSPLVVLGRGYALVRDDNAAIVKTIGQVSPGDDVTVSVSDGDLVCAVTATVSREDAEERKL